jgi:hypothetical protein
MLLQEVNGRLLDLLVLASQNPNASGLPLALDLRDVLEHMDPTARERAAASPFLLVEFGFRDAARWSSVRGVVESINPREGYFPHPQALELAQMTLILAWSLVRSNRDAAFVMLGVSPACAGIVADLRLQDLQRIAAERSAWIRPRWETRADVWRRLLSTADTLVSPPPDQLGTHGLKLFFGNLFSNEPAGKSGRP